MRLTPEMNAAIGPKIDELAARHSFSRAAVLTLLDAVIQGQGRMAQFDHPELGGRGQWMAGGMTMVGDMFNHGLKARVAAVCEELSALLPGILRPQDGGWGAEAADQVKTSASWAFSTSVPWWPENLGSPSQAGSQNATRYAIFPAARRIAVGDGTRYIVYDTLDYKVGGVSQQGGSDTPLILSTDRGAVAVTSLPVVSESRDNASHASSTWSQSSSTSFAASTPAADIKNPEPAAQPSPHTTSTSHTPSASPAPRAAVNQEHSESILRTIERLAELRDKGAITDAEFAAKKTELLSAL